LQEAVYYFDTGASEKFFAARSPQPAAREPRTTDCGPRTADYESGDEALDGRPRTRDALTGAGPRPTSETLPRRESVRGKGGHTPGSGSSAPFASMVCCRGVAVVRLKE